MKWLLQLVRSGCVAAGVWLWLCLAVWCAGACAQDFGFQDFREKKVYRGVTQGFYCSHWGGGNYVAIDGVTDREATSLFVPDSLFWHGHKFQTGELGSSAFQNMIHLERCSFNVWSVLVHAFTGCESLRVLESRNPEPPAVGQHIFYFGAPDEVFDDYHFLTMAVVVPPGSEQAYREAHGWREFHTIVSHEPRHEDYDLAAIAARIAELEHERDSLAVVERQLRDSLAALENGDLDIPTALTAHAGDAAAAHEPRVVQANPLPESDEQRIELISTKILSGGFEYKSRFSPEVILTGHTDSTALHLVVPDTIAINTRRYPVTQMWEDAFASHGHLLSLTLPAGLTNVSPGAFTGCRELRLLELRSAVPPAFRSIDNGDCPPEQVIDNDLCARLVLVVPPGSEPAYRKAAGWSRCARITSTRPTLAELGVTPAAERHLALDAHLCRLAARQAHIATALRALKKAFAF